jgi:hypothetical protein
MRQYSPILPIVHRTIGLDFNCALHNKTAAEVFSGCIFHWAQRSFRRITMNQPFETIQKLGKDSFNATVKALEVATTGTQAIAVETADYAKKSFEQTASTFEKFVGVKSLDKVIEIQTDYVKSAYEGFVAQSTKTSELYTKLAQDSFAPFNALRSATQSTVATAKSTSRAK